MTNLSKKELDLFSNRILEDYDSKNPSIIFKEKRNISNEDALLIQTNVAKLREKRGEEIVGYKIGCISKDTQKKMGFTQPACGYLWKSELYNSGVVLNKKNYTNPSMEAEFGIILNRDINPELSSFEYILESIEAIYPLVEIVRIPEALDYYRKKGLGFFQYLNCKNLEEQKALLNSN